MQSELKPCPACGPDGHPESHGSIGRGGRFVRCEVCGFQGPASYNQDDAIAAWNTRASDAEIARLTEALRKAEDRVKALREALYEILDLPGEINPSNYDHDDACELNRQFCYGAQIARQALAGAKP